MKEIITKKWEVYTKTNKEFDEIYHKIALHYKLSDSSFWILYFLYAVKRPCTQMEICKEWNFSKQTVNSTIKNLENMGYITKENDEDNKLYKKIRLTSLGKEVAEKTVKNVMILEDIAFSKISEEELDIIIKLLQKVLSSFKEEANKIIK